MQVASAYRVALVQQIEAKCWLSLRVREAFLTVPRHVFLTPREDVEREQWLNEVYQDTAVVTKLDGGGMPLSSSSQPSVMAWMLEALEILPEMRVLEIGTGTGYNAALLACLTGDPTRVTTIEIDPELTTQARLRIEKLIGPGMITVTGDGKRGMPEYGPYDRIIATASAFPVPPAWIAQLAPHGRLVLDLRGKMGGGLMVLEKQRETNATGRFLAMKETISFMGLRATAKEETQAKRFALPSLHEQHLYEPETVEHTCASHFSSYEQFRGEDDSFNLWVQCLFPSLSIKWKRQEKRAFARLVEGESQTTLTIEQRGNQMGVAVKGTCPLWTAIVQAYQAWLGLEKPGYTDLTLVITSESQEMRVAHKGQSVTLKICH
ncbi:MAG TPA: methyltransferase domain-containing protein [Ktedonobacteraceae bacterium]